MNTSNKKFLDDNRHFHEQMIKNQTLRGLGHGIIIEMKRVMSEEFRPGYDTDINCGDCLFRMVRELYASYDAWIDAQPKEPDLNHVVASFPHQEKPIQAEQPTDIAKRMDAGQKKNKHFHRK